MVLEHVGAYGRLMVNPMTSLQAPSHLVSQDVVCDFEFLALLSDFDLLTMFLT